jgi:hypothetical protein
MTSLAHVSYTQPATLTIPQERGGESLLVDSQKPLPRAEQCAHDSVRRADAVLERLEGRDHVQVGLGRRTGHGDPDRDREDVAVHERVLVVPRPAFDRPVGMGTVQVCLL